MTDKNLISNLNPNLGRLEDDYFYHLYLGKKSHELKEMFGDVKFVCMGVPTGLTLKDITEKTDRYSMFKVGPVLCINHGIGCPSLSILLNEVLKLLLYAECKDVTFFRIGTSGGIGMEPGTVVITEEAVDGLLRPQYQRIEKNLTTVCDKDLIRKLIELSDQIQDKNFKVVSGKTLYQARIDGIFCEYTNEEKLKFLTECKEKGIANIEMESLCFAGLLNNANIKFAIVCVTLLDRLVGDQITELPEKLLEFQERPFEIVGQYIKNVYNSINFNYD